VPPLRLPELDFMPYDSHRLSSLSHQTLERVRTLAALALDPGGESPPLVVASALAIMNKTIPRSDFAGACRILEQGMTADPMELLGRWQSIGYEMEETVEAPGQMSRRGGIVDIFPPTSQLPVRLEFFGNRVESMRAFDPESQRSSGMVSSVIVTPVREFLPAPNGSRLSSLDLQGCDDELRQRFETDLARLRDGEWFPGAEFYAPLFNTGSAFDYLAEDALLVLDEPEGIELVVGRLSEESEQLRAARIHRGELPRDYPSPYLACDEVKSQFERRNSLDLLPSVSPDTSAVDDTWTLPFARSQSYGGQLERFLKAARQLVGQRRRVFVISRQADRLAELLQNQDIHTSPASNIDEVPPPGSITIIRGSVDGGWILDDRLTLVTDTELFGFVKQPRASGRRSPRRAWLLPQLSEGDYVVHIDHGIARFNGLTRMASRGIEGDYLVLEYAAGDRLYVPTERMDRITRYVGAGDQAPRLSRLRGREWQSTKRKVRESVEEIARELLGLYASRELAPGFAFSPDSLWQQELEASFPYVETPDQIEAIAAVKEDMEKARPADRLICGDVGYGKTEIALRAAFKAVMDNKQVAILVPTTVLAQQHLVTFTERLQTFPVKVEMLSRFCPPEREGEIIQGLAAGTVDICIGTHRLLQKDIAFKDLGMVIVDEEQQFGVVQKEKLRQIRQEVDTLALSATPIPRTLHMSLSGIRDMSIVETPPEDRLSVKTYVGVFDADLVRQVILRELERNGQVFFVHNRVQSIGLVAERLQEAVPEARIAIAHGQMHEEQLEKVMTDFMEGEYDVLLTTTIIQLGLDMPNVNTLIIDRADKFGLGQLYQLRGRVGRGINQAYAYFLVDKGKRLTPQAYKRLRTIVEATELGSGFGIAMKDLEIRGAGNLLGVKQSGHIAAIGFDLYCQLLAGAVEELRAKQSGEARKSVMAGRDDQSPSISLPLDAYIPEEYVSDLGTRLGLYHRLAGLQHFSEVENMAGELEDRFGPLPGPAGNLLYIVRVRVLAMSAGVSSVFTQGRHIVVKSGEPVIATIAKQAPGRGCDGAVRIATTQIRLDTRLLGNGWREVLEEILRSSCV
ncbi:MAG: transcription-repair coupling factor, partial [Dehalococcoidia bacterium]